jgi:predicted nuclease of restriction endonuclease-like RecB superfamily
MLTGKLVRVRYARDRVIPCYLNAQESQWLDLAEQLLTLFRAGVGQSRGQLEADIDELFGNLPQPIIHQGLAKLLEDRGDFEVLPGQPPEQVRAAAFRAAAQERQRLAQQPGQRFERDVVLRSVGAELGLEPAAVEAGLFADLKSEQRLVRFEDITPQRLLERYNVALAQAVLLRSIGREVEVRSESPALYRQLFRQIKFRRLLCEVEAIDAGTHRLRLDGPLSLFSATQKYGLQLALFLPTLLLCDDFTLEAELRWGAERRPKRFVLTASDGLVSHQAELGAYVPPEIGMFVELFRKKVSDWDISEESEVIPLGRSFWVPDFRLTHRDSGRTVLLDVLGFWRRSSVERHLALLREHADRPFLVALGEQLRVEEADLAELPAQVLRFRTLPLAEEVARRALQLLFPEAPAQPS